MLRWASEHVAAISTSGMCAALKISACHHCLSFIIFSLVKKVQFLFQVSAGWWSTSLRGRISPPHSHPHPLQPLHLCHRHSCPRISVVPSLSPHASRAPPVSSVIRPLPLKLTVSAYPPLLALRLALVLLARLLVMLLLLLPLPLLGWDLWVSRRQRQTGGRASIAAPFRCRLASRLRAAHEIRCVRNTLHLPKCVPPCKFTCISRITNRNDTVYENI